MNRLDKLFFFGFSLFSRRFLFLRGSAGCFCCWLSLTRLLLTNDGQYDNDDIQHRQRSANDTKILQNEVRYVREPDREENGQNCEDRLGVDGYPLLGKPFLNEEKKKNKNKQILRNRQKQKPSQIN